MNLVYYLVHMWVILSYSVTDCLEIPLNSHINMQTFNDLHQGTFAYVCIHVYMWL